MSIIVSMDSDLLACRDFSDEANSPASHQGATFRPACHLQSLLPAKAGVERLLRSVEVLGFLNDPREAGKSAASGCLFITCSLAVIFFLRNPIT